VRRIVLLAAMIIAVSAIVPVGAAEATRRTFVDNNCHSVAFRPSYILFACGDGGFYATELAWSSWHPFRAAGRGIFHQNDCDPSCAGGTFHRVPGRIVLKRRGRCPGVHHYVFMRAVITFDETLLSRNQVRTDIGCPF
jgi:hypothetical protein